MSMSTSHLLGILDGSVQLHGSVVFGNVTGGGVGGFGLKAQTPKVSYNEFLMHVLGQSVRLDEKNESERFHPILDVTVDVDTTHHNQPCIR